VPLSLLLAQLLLLRGAKQVLTLRGPRGVRRGAALRDLGIIEDGAILIRDGVIAEIGSTRRLENLKDARAAIEIPANGRIIVPGFVDAHLSLKIDSTRSGEKHFHKRKSMVDFYEGSLSLLRSCLHHGTLTADVKAGGSELNRSLDVPVLRKLADIGTNPICTMRTWHVGNMLEGAVDTELLALLGKIARRKLIHSIEFNGPSSRAVDLDLLAAIANSQIAIKVSWAGGTGEQLSHCLEHFRPVAVYCVAPGLLSSGEAAVLANSYSLAVLGAGKEVFEGPALRTGRELVDAGVAVALSSGYDSGSAASFSMQMSLALAVVRLGLTVEEAFSAATINAAYAAGRGDVVGSLELGKKADLLLLNASDYREVPSHFGVNHVDMVIRDGNIVLNRTRWKAMHN
jgi:imidazolonepropionase